MPPLRSFGSAAVDPWAAIEQLALVACVYRDRPDAAAQLLGSDGQVLHWVHRPDSWPPSYCLCRSGTGRYFLAIAGTTNAGQWVGHLQGSFGSAYNPGPCLVNGQWLSVWQGLRDELVPLLPFDPSSYTLHLSGHSYGGAVAQLGGIELARDHGPGKVQVLTFGSPKVLTGGYTGPQPSATWRVRSLSDAVGYTPPDGPLWFLLGTIPNPIWNPIIGAWTHYGSDAWLQADGAFGTSYATPSPLGPGVATGPISEHLTRNYWGRLRAHHQAHPSPPPDVAATLQLTDDVLNGSPLQQAVNLPLVVPWGPAGLLVVPADGAAPQFFAGNGAFTMPYPEAVTGGNIITVQAYINMAKQGWSESMTLHVVGAQNPLEAAEQWAMLWFYERKKILASAAHIEACRISEFGVDGDSYLDEAPALGMGSGLVPTQPAHPAECWRFKVSDETGQVKLSMPVRGLPQSLVNVRSDGSPRGLGTPTAIEDYKKEMRKLLTQDVPVPGNGTVRAVLHTYQRNPGMIPDYGVSEYSVSADGYVQVLLEGTADDITRNTEVKLSHDRSKCGKGIAGRYFVMRKTIVAGNALLVLNVKPRCNTSPVDFTGGLVQRVFDIFVRVRFIHGAHIGQHKVGAPFGATAGRRLRRC